MPQTWLHTNRRAIAAGFVVPLALVALAVLLAVWLDGTWRWLGIVPLAIASLMAWSLVKLIRQPRLAYENGELFVYLSGSFTPERLPVEVVECFFIGQAPSLLPRKDESAPPSRTQAVVIRLAESASQWHHRPVRPQLGQWCDGYITVRGTWSEPIRPALVQRLNERLVAAHREQRSRRATGG